LEGKLEVNKRIPRGENYKFIGNEFIVTTAFWKFSSGAIGSLMHGVLLHGDKYENEIEILGDGYRICLIDPYGKCKVQVRDLKR
jgi:hypothetical protein